MAIEPPQQQLLYAHLNDLFHTDLNDYERTVGEITFACDLAPWPATTTAPCFSLDGKVTTATTPCLSAPEATKWHSRIMVDRILSGRWLLESRHLQDRARKGGAYHVPTTPGWDVGKINN